MPGLTKQTQAISFIKGVDTKTDEKQVAFDSFLELVNSNFKTQGSLQSRNGFGTIGSGQAATTIATFNGNLTELGNNQLYAFVDETNTFLSRGNIERVGVDVQPMVRSSTSQSAVDMALSNNSLCCVVWLDSDGNSKYQISDFSTGQIITGPTNLPTTAVQARVFALGYYFVITFNATVSASPHFQYIAIPFRNVSNPGAATDIATTISGLTAAYDAVVASNGSLYIAWSASDPAIRATYIDANLNQSNTVVLASAAMNLISVTSDDSQNSPHIWITSWETATNHGYSRVIDSTLLTLKTAFQVITNKELIAMTTVADNLQMTLLYEVSNNYSYGTPHRSDFIEKAVYSQAGATVTAAAVLLRGVGLGSKAFLEGDDNEIYFLSAYAGVYQPTYFLHDISGNVIAKLAYGNAGGYVATQVLPNVTIVDDGVIMPYLFKDFIAPVNKMMSANQIAGIYTQLGINLVHFDMSHTAMQTVETGSNLLIASGIVWAYDGVKPVEQNFHLYPEELVVTTSTSGGNLADQTYFYAAVYEWTDGQGNLHRSSPSVPISQVTSGGNVSTNTVKVATLRLTYKIAPNKVRIVLYRWSTANPIFYQITSITSPTLNDLTADNISYTDTVADSTIIGNTILYITGGVVENIAPPPASAISVINSRVVIVNAENKNEAWYSKPVVAGTPVEFSDLFTLFVSPTIGAQRSTGDIKVLGGMDDKILFFKDSAIYYVVGRGPDITGAQNDFSDPIFITSTVGTDNPNMAMTPNGLMFKSDKGIWLLGRDLSTAYIGAAVEGYNDIEVVSALTVPGTNEVRFALADGTTLVYDYYVNQWGSYSNVPAISSTIYQGLHTYVDEDGVVRQETPGQYIDGSKPVLKKFKTAWFNLAGLQGYIRSYWFTLLGTYRSPHRILIEVAYDYADGPEQSVIITPTNGSPNWGGDDTWGSGDTWGGPGRLEQWRIFFKKQRCEAFQLTISELSSTEPGAVNGPGASLSGINLVYGAKKAYVPIAAARSTS